MMPWSKEDAKEWQQNHPESGRAANKRYRDKHHGKRNESSMTYNRIKRKQLDAEKNKPCMDCGGSFPPECMDWDHRPGEDKLRLVTHTTNDEKRHEEQAKCDLVCANCHRTRTKARYAARDVVSY